MAENIFLSDVRVSNFRTLREIELSLKSLTVLIGENNSGKTSFLEALNWAIGAGRKSITSDDIYLSPTERKLPLDREVIVDVRIFPVSDANVRLDSFPVGSYWTKLWGKGISQDAQDNEFVAIRARFRWSAEANDYETERLFIGDWKSDITDIRSAKEKNGVSAQQLDPIALHFLDARRDIHEDLTSRGSFWQRLVSDPGLSEETATELESLLSGLNERIISESKVLTHVQGHLNEINHAVICDSNSVSITPVPRHLRDLSKGINVNFSTRGASSFPLTKHGMGTRSLASILTFRAYTTWRAQAQVHSLAHSLLALEEPEAHLHPQSQRSLFQLVSKIPGQKFISTHSPYIASQTDLSDLRHFRKDGPETHVTSFDVSGLDAEELRKIARMVMNTRGDLLYASAIILFEGETEEQALPILAEAFSQRHPNEMGMSFISVNGAGNYLPFLRLAKSFSIPWFIYSDGEADPVRNLQTALTSLGVGDHGDLDNVFIIPRGLNFETILIDEGYQVELEGMLNEFHSSTGYLDEYIAEKHGQRGKRGVLREYKSNGGRDRAMHDVLATGKTMYGAPIGHCLARLEGPRRFPGKLNALFERIFREQTPPVSTEVTLESLAMALAAETPIEMIVS